MTSKEIFSSETQRGMGDAAVDGILAGVLGGIFMILFLLTAALIAGGPLTAVLGRFDIQAASRPIVGLLTHVAISAIYGLFFGVLFAALTRLWPALQRWGWAAGLVFGLILYGIAQAVFNAGINSGLAQFSPLNLLLAHMIYGIFIGIVIQRKWRREIS